MMNAKAIGALTGAALIAFVAAPAAATPAFLSAGGMSAETASQVQPASSRLLGGTSIGLGVGVGLGGKSGTNIGAEVGAAVGIGGKKGVDIGVGVGTNVNLGTLGLGSHGKKSSRKGRRGRR